MIVFFFQFLKIYHNIQLYSALKYFYCLSYIVYCLSMLMAKIRKWKTKFINHFFMFSKWMK